MFFEVKAHRPDANELKRRASYALRKIGDRAGVSFMILRLLILLFVHNLAVFIIECLFPCTA